MGFSLDFNYPIQETRHKKVKKLKSTGYFPKYCHIRCWIWQYVSRKYQFSVIGRKNENKRILKQEIFLPKLLRKMWHYPLHCSSVHLLVQHYNGWGGVQPRHWERWPARRGEHWQGFQGETRGGEHNFSL